MRVASALDDVEAAARAVRDAEQRWRDDMREVRGEVESVRELVPRMIEKHAGAQSAALTELQNELRSLKTLLVARQGAAAATAAAVATPVVTDTAAVSGTSSPAPVPTPTQAAANALLAPRGKASIPAWQLAAPAANGSSASVASTVPSTTASASASGASSPTRE